MSTRAKTWPALLATGCMVLAAGAARAQSVDYGALETLFGEPVTTSVTGSPQRASDVPAAMEIITADEIRRSGARDIPDVLRHVAGMDVMRWTNNAADVGVRGYDQLYSPRLLVLVDGRQVYADHYGWTPWNTIGVELGEIRQIEIVKGPNSALFGFNAVGGVINIITYNPLHDDIGSASLTGGTQGDLAASFVKGWKISDRAAIRLTAGYARDDEFKTAIPSYLSGTARTGNERFSTSAQGVVQLTDDIGLTLEATHTLAHASEVDPAFEYIVNRFITDAFKAEVNANTGIGLVQLQAYSNTIQARLDTLFAGQFRFRNNIMVVQAQDIFSVGSDHTFRVSAEYRYSSLPTTPYQGGKLGYGIVAVGGMWAWNIMPKLTLTNAVRYDHLMLNREGTFPTGFPLTNDYWNRTYSALTFNSAAVWRASDTDTLRLTAARGEQLPNLTNLGGLLMSFGPNFFIAGLPNLKPVTVTNYEIGWDRDLPSIGGKFRVEAFHQENQDLIAPSGGFEVIAGSSLYTATNLGGSRADGMEIALSAKLSESWRWGASYRYENVHDEFVPAGADGALGVEFQHTTPDHVLKANLGWADDGWEIDGYLQFQSATMGVTPKIFGGYRLMPVNAYAAVDARVGYRITDELTLALSGQNLLTAEQQQTVGPKVERRVLVMLSAGL